MYERKMDLDNKEKKFVWIEKKRDPALTKAACELTLALQSVAAAFALHPCGAKWRSVACIVYSVSVVYRVLHFIIAHSVCFTVHIAVSNEKHF